MKPATVKQIKDELKNKDASSLIELCLSLSKFKKENKELLTYLLFEADDEQSYIASVKEEIKEQFDEINTTSYYFMRKSVRKILRGVKKHIRYSKQTLTEVELLLYFCHQMKELSPRIYHNTTLNNTYHRQLQMAKKKVATLHEDLQHDFAEEFSELD